MSDQLTHAVRIETDMVLEGVHSNKQRLDAGIDGSVDPANFAITTSENALSRFKTLLEMWATNEDISDVSITLSRIKPEDAVLSDDYCEEDWVP